MRLFERTTHRLNENGNLSNEIPSYDEVLRRLENLRLYGDDSTTQVEDTPGGQVVRLLNPVGGEGGFAESSLQHTDFVVRQDSADEFIVGEGGIAVGDESGTIPETDPLSSGINSVFVNLVIYYHTGSEVYVVDHVASLDFPAQTKYATYHAEWFPLAYVTVDGGGNITQIDQLNSNVIRVNRLN